LATDTKKTAGAPAQAAGYLFQLRYALFRALKRLVRDPTGSVGIERLDDVTIQSGDSVLQIEQLKHSTDTTTQFNDMSPSVWRTLGNWSRAVQHSNVDLAILELFFVTNASIAEDSGLAQLGLADEDRDYAAAVEKLTESALASHNQQTSQDRDAFLVLDTSVRNALVRAIRVVPNTPGLEALGSEVEDVLHYACEQSQLEEFRLELEGWWFDRVAGILSHGIGPLVPLIELDGRVAYLREKYKTSVLQIDIDGASEAPDNLGDYVFVKQVFVLNVGDRRLRNAQRDFLKASAQRSKWLRESRIDPAELNEYDGTLEDRWSTQSAILIDELPSPPSEEDKCKCGRAILGWAETQQTPLRGASAQFLTSGSYHSLADQLKLGWHPEFKVLFGPKS
jgi:ABC-3C protein